MDDALEETETSANDTVVKEQIGAKPIGRIVPKMIVATLPSMTNAGSIGCNSHTDTDHCQLRIGTTLSRVVTSAL